MGGRSLANFNVEELHKLYFKNKELDEWVFKKLTFELSDFQPILGGQNAKFILKGNDGRLWIFKAQEQYAQMDMVHSWLLLFGENKPVSYNITLPINGELVNGIIQEFIMHKKTLDNISIPKLSKDEIEFIQRQQIIDWFTCSEETFDCDPGQFLKKNNEIINVEKKRIASADYLNESLIGSLNNPLYMRKNYYNIFWKAYINKEIDVDFRKSFELIDYIQSLDDGFIKEIFKSCLPEKFPVSLLIKRKNQLRNDFEWYYHYLADQRGAIFKVYRDKGSLNLLKRAIKKLEEGIRKKEVILEKLEKKGNVPQKNIEVVLSKRISEVIKKFGFPDAYFQDNFMNLKNELDGLKGRQDNLNNKIALYLFLFQLKRIEQGITEENFFEFSPLCAYSPKAIDIGLIEANLRVTNYQKKGVYIDTFEKFNNSDPESILSVLYILTTCFTFGEPQEAINRCHLDNKYDKEIMQALDILNIRSLDRNSIPRSIELLNKLSKGTGWRRFFLAFLYYQEAFWHNDASSREKAISELNKTICLSKHKRLSYISYLFLGYLHEHNKDCFRFGKGFNVDKAINAYQNALKIDPDSVIAHLNLYTLYLIKSKSKLVWYHLNRIKEIDAEYADENFHFGQDLYNKIEKLKEIDRIEILRECSLSAEQHQVLNLFFLLKEGRDPERMYIEETKRKGYFKNEN